MPFDQFLRILRARWVMLVSILGFIVVTTVLVSLILPKNYSATATLMVDIKPDPVGGYSPMAAAGQYLATQIDLIKSPLVALKVVRATKLAESPPIVARWQAETGGEGDREVWAAELISKGMEVKPGKESSLISIDYEGTDPQFAALMANTFARSYMDSTVQLRVDPAKRYSDFFEDRAKLAKERLEKAQARLTEAQQSNGIVLNDERMDYETSRLNEMSSLVTQLRAAKVETSNRSAAAQQNPEHVQDVVSNTLITSLKAQLATVEARYQELSAQYGDQHPTLIELRANMDNLRDRLRSETRKIAAGVGVINNITGSRIAEAQSAFEAQRARVLQLKSERAKLAALEREVVMLQNIYENIQARQSQVNLESNSSQSNIYLVSAATPPNKPASPRIFMNTMLALLFGTIVATLLTLGAESLDRRLRGPADIVLMLDIPVIGALPSPTAKPSRFKFIQSSVKSDGLMIPHRDDQRSLESA